MPDESSPEGLTDFQVEVARVFFGLAESEGFLLAGGAALVAQALTDRPTRDLGFSVGPDSGNVVVAWDAFETAAQERGWSVRRVRDGVTFCRLVVSGSDSLVVDLALDTPPSRPPTASFIGPTFDLEELAGRKTLALFDRAEARDFTDVYALVQRYGKELLLARAAEVDMGFDVAVFAQMLGTLSRFEDGELPIPGDRVPELRSFFANWAVELVDSLAS
ncbi:nucleotidyl transferase AbiEii/AbiGii toxin family protein [Actinosynnema sp. NPDC050801]|uniref:nucleotidyl transferase AbiEii/AbiGii toxin family protein n=1 Tax=unclassified Actinosynnema TaxID=2637065 RepID=UPI0033C05CD5